MSNSSAATNTAGTSFLDLPREIRDKIYGLCLVGQYQPIDPTPQPYGDRQITTGLLRVNKAIYQEAYELLLEKNQFDFHGYHSTSVASFLDKIGSSNVRFVQIDFPKLRTKEGQITIDQDSLDTLAVIKNRCTGLKTLMTYAPTTNAMEVRLDELDQPELVTKALTQADSYFRSITSVQEIITQVFDDGSDGYAREEMRNRGWKVDVGEYFCISDEEMISDESDFDYGMYEMEDLVARGLDPRDYGYDFDSYDEDMDTSDDDDGGNDDEDDEDSEGEGDSSSDGDDDLQGQADD